jgi:rubrerythrin
MKTGENLKDAFAGESEANRKYEEFSKKAESEGYKNIARLFKAASFSESIHARNHLRVMGGVNNTLQNLIEARNGENYEVTSMYPQFIEKAKEEDNEEAERTFTWAIEAEKVHEKFYQEALDRISEGKDLDETSLFVCGGCGFTVDKEAPERCPVCGAPKKMFQRF